MPDPLHDPSYTPGTSPPSVGKFTAAKTRSALVDRHRDMLGRLKRSAKLRGIISWGTGRCGFCICRDSKSTGGFAVDVKRVKLAAAGRTQRDKRSGESGTMMGDNR